MREAYQLEGLLNVPAASVSVDGNCEVASILVLIFRRWKLDAFIKPLELGALYSSIIEIESIYVDMQYRKKPARNAETALRRPRSHPPKRMGGYS